MQPSGVSRYLLLDILRGLAALSVVFNHWKHFQFTTPEVPMFMDRERVPLYGLFKPILGWVDHG